MVVHAVRRGASVLAVLVLSLGLVVAAPAKPASAAGLSAPPGMTVDAFVQWLRGAGVKLKVPGSVQGRALTPGGPLAGSTHPNLTVGQRVAGTVRSVKQSQLLGRVVTTQATFDQHMAGPNAIKKWGVKGLRGAGNVGLAAMVLDLSYSAGTFVSTKVGGFDASQGLLCDLGAVFDTGCLLSNDPAYVVDSDLPPDTMGWIGTPSMTTQGQRAPISTTVVAVDASGLVNGVGNVTITWTVGFSGSRLDACNNGPSGQQIRRVDPTGVSGTGLAATNPTLNSLWWPSVCTAGSSPVPGPFSARFVLSGPMDASAPRLDLSAQGAVVASWYPPGHAKRPSTSSGVRWWRTTWKCDAGALVTADGPHWREGDETWPDPPAANCDGGTVTYQRVEQMTDGVTAGTLLYEWQLPAEMGEWAGAYPECTDGSCELTLHRLDSSTGTRLDCFQNPQLCLGWFADPLKVEHYVCTYGTHDVDLAECNAYAKIFDTGEYTDPETGAPAPDPVYGVDPVRPPGGGVIVPTLPQDNACPPPFTWSSLINPWYYYKGTVCALREVFVPSDAFWSQQSAALKAGAGSRAPFSLMGAIPTAFDGVKSGWSGACTSMPNFSALPGKTLALPCTPPRSDAFAVARGLMAVCVWVLTAFGIWRMVFHGIGGRE